MTECEAGYLLVCAALWSGRNTLTFRRINHHHDGGSGSSETIAVRRHIPVSFRSLRLKSKHSPVALLQKLILSLRCPF